MRTLNLGILAHVDAGKTTLTERLLHNSGVIDELGSVDDGNTQTDTLALERARGITIKAAVVSFVAGDVAVNLIDTPGHPDFIAEVERVLGVLDGAVLVVSAVEGVQAQTRVLMRALRRLAIPTLIFVNKTDRRGADPARVLRELRERLSPAAVGWDDERRLAEVLADHDDAILEAYVADDVQLSAAQLRAALVEQTRAARVHPVFTGSARSGAGVADLVAGRHRAAARGRGRRRRPALRQRVQDRARAGGREGRLRPHVLGRAADARPAAGREGDRDQRVRGRRVRPPRGGGCWSDRQAVGPRRGADRRRDRGGARRERPRVLAADARDRRGPGRRHRPPRAARRARPARRAGPADRRPPGRRRAVALALRRGAEGGHPGDAGGRLRRRRLVPRVDHDLHRAAARRGRGVRADRGGLQPAARHRRPARGAGAARAAGSRSGWRSSSARCRPRSSRRSRRRCRRR